MLSNNWTFSLTSLVVMLALALVASPAITSSFSEAMALLIPSMP